MEEEIIEAINGVWIFIAGVLCFLMQAGFGLLEVGSIRAKNAQNVLLKNILDGCTAALAYWATGFALALGEGGNPFLGKTYFFLIGYEDQLVYFFFFYVFAGTTATIVSGAVAERCRFRAYMIYTFVLTGFIYPIASHWLWSPDGFFHGRVIDYAAGGAVHMVGGAAALSGAWILGPRIHHGGSAYRWDSVVTGPSTIGTSTVPEVNSAFAVPDTINEEDEEKGEQVTNSVGNGTSTSAHECRRRSVASLRSSMMPTPYGAL